MSVWGEHRPQQLEQQSQQWRGSEQSSGRQSLSDPVHLHSAIEEEMLF
jgi:hypothetical protein